MFQELVDLIHKKQIVILKRLQYKFENILMEWMILILRK